MTTQWVKMTAKDLRGDRRPIPMLYFVNGGFNMSRTAKNWVAERAQRLDVLISKSGDKLAIQPSANGLYSVKNSAFAASKFPGYEGRLELVEEGGMLVATLPNRSLRDRTNGTQE